MLQTYLQETLYNGNMENASGEELIITSGTIAIMLAQTMSNEEIETFCELLSHVKHNLEIIKYRRQEKHEHHGEKCR